MNFAKTSISINDKRTPNFVTCQEKKWLLVWITVEEICTRKNNHDFMFERQRPRNWFRVFSSRRPAGIGARAPRRRAVAVQQTFWAQLLKRVYIALFLLSVLCCRKFWISGSHKSIRKRLLGRASFRQAIHTLKAPRVEKPSKGHRGKSYFYQQTSVIRKEKLSRSNLDSRWKKNASVRFFPFGRFGSNACWWHRSCNGRCVCQYGWCVSE